MRGLKVDVAGDGFSGVWWVGGGDDAFCSGTTTNQWNHTITEHRVWNVRLINNAENRVKAAVFE